MNLKRYLLTRMLMLGLLCWGLTSVYVLMRTASELRVVLDQDAQRLHEMVEYSLYQRQITPEIEGSPVLVGSQYGLQLAPYCVRYEGYNGQVREENCGAEMASPAAWRVLAALGLPGQPLVRDVGLWGQPFGEVTIAADPVRVLQKFWGNLSDLLLLTTLLVGSMAVLTYVVVGRALSPAGRLVEQLDQIAISEDSPPPARLPEVQPREFGRIAQGVNRLADRLWRMTQARRQLMGRLLRVQEDERRELAHWVHADLGQSLSLIGVHCTQLRGHLPPGETSAREQLEHIDLMVEDAFGRLRAVLVNKCPPVLEGADLGMAIGDLCTRWEIAAGEGWTVHTDLQATALNALDKDRALCVYRTVEEALQNAARHGGPGGVVHVELAGTPQAVQLAVSNSVHTPPNTVPKPSGGMGLHLLAERVRVHGGQFRAQMAQADRFEVLASFDLNGEAAFG